MLHLMLAGHEPFDAVFAQLESVVDVFVVKASLGVQEYQTRQKELL